MKLIDCDGDAWEERDGGWSCLGYPESWLPNRDALDLVWGPLYEEDDD